MCTKLNQSFTDYTMIILYLYMLSSLTYFYNHLKEHFLVDVILVLAFYHHLFNTNWHISKKLHNICNFLVLVFICLISPFVPTLWLINKLLIEVQQKNTNYSGVASNDCRYGIDIGDVITCGTQFNSFLQDSILGHPTSVSYFAQSLIVNNLIKFTKLVYTNLISYSRFLVNILDLGYTGLRRMCINTIETIIYCMIIGYFGLLSIFLVVICILVQVIIITCSGLMSLFRDIVCGFTRELKPCFGDSLVSFVTICGVFMFINLLYTGLKLLFFSCVGIMKFIYPGLLLFAASACFIS